MHLALEVSVMWDRLLFAMDQYESGQTALGFTAGLAAATGVDVRVLHVREISKWARVPPLETKHEAELLVSEAVLSLRLAGIGAEGTTCSAPVDYVARRIVEESMHWICDAIVLGTRRLHGIYRLSGRGTREQILRLSPLPVIAAPTPLINGMPSPRPFRSGANSLDGVPERRPRIE
jgi:nucleotide-binding universal stress UspA family protein